MDFKKIKDFEFDKDKKSSLQIKAVKGLAVFLVIMFLLTVISRAADSLTIAKVNVIDASSMAIAHNIEADGTITSNKDIAVSTAPGVRIDSVEVQEGHLVKAGDLLFQLDMDDLQKKLLEAQKELRVIEATASDKAANDAIAEAEEQKARDRAYEDYDDSLREAAQAVKDAKRDMNDALSAYQKAKKESSGSSEEDSSVRDQLEKTVTEKTTALTEAQDQLTALKTTIIQEKEKTLKEQTDQKIQELIEEEVSIRMKEQETSDTSESGESSTTETRSEEEIRKEVAAEIEETRADVEESLRSDVENEVDKKYAEKLKTLQEAVEAAEAELADANNALAVYDDEQAAAAANSKDSQLSELYSAYEEKKAVYEESVKAYNETKKTADRGLEDMDTTEAIDTVTELTQDDEKELKELEVKAFQEVVDADGKVTAPSDGLVTKVNVTTGEVTTEDTAIRISDQKAGYRFTASITKADAKYLKAGDKISLEIGNDVTVDNLPITKLEMSSEDKDSYNVIADIPSKVTKISNFATMRVTRESERYYTCVPLNVLHSDGSNYFVYVVTTKESVLGSETTATKVDVEILDKNSEYAAIDGFFDWDQQFVLSSNKTLNDGDRVRIQDTSDSQEDDR